MEMSQDLPLEPAQVSVSAESDTSSILIGAETPQKEELPSISFLSEDSLQTDSVPSDTATQETPKKEESIDLGNLFGSATPSLVETISDSEPEEVSSMTVSEEKSSVEESVPSYDF